MTVSLEVKRAIADAVTLRAANDVDAMKTAIQAIADDGPRSFFIACAAWAELVALGVDPEQRGHCPHDPPCEKMMAFEIEDRTTGEVMDPSTLPEEMQARVWALRFISTIANRDFVTAWALFRVADAAPDGVGMGPFEVLNIAAQVYRGDATWAEM